jgi:hypothetical protein
MDNASTPLSTLLTLPRYRDHVFDVDGAKWKVAVLFDGMFTVDEVSDGFTPRSATLSAGFCHGRASTVGDLVRLTVEQSNPKHVTIQAVARALLGGSTLHVEKDGELTMAFSVGPYSTAVDGDLGHVCMQDPGMRLLKGVQEFYVTDFRGAYPVGRERMEEDWSAFGAAFTFVEWVGPIRAREALEKAGERWACAA